MSYRRLISTRPARFHVTADYCALSRGLPKEALLHEDLAVHASDLHGPGHVQHEGLDDCTSISPLFRAWPDFSQE